MSKRNENTPTLLSFYTHFDLLIYFACVTYDETITRMRKILISMVAGIYVIKLQYKRYMIHQVHSASSCCVPGPRLTEITCLYI